VRNKLPITSAITPPLLHLFEHVDKPIISFHYEAGNILAATGKKVVQVVTDPHDRDQYVTHANLENIKFCVMDEKTKEDFLEKAMMMNVRVDPHRIIITGLQLIHALLLHVKTKSDDAQKRPLRLCITTGGLGTNKDEIKINS
jgi:hypothetical protein